MAHAMTREGGKEGGQSRDDETGRYAKTFTDAAFLAFLAENELVGSADVADAFGTTHQTAYRRLKALEAEGRVESRKVGRSLIWTLSGEENED